MMILTVAGRIVLNIAGIKEMMKMADDKYLELLYLELKCRKSVRSVLRERILHEDQLIIDIQKKILEYANEDKDVGTTRNEHID
jgi:DNA-dependent RNA polymerase auxiliary subunit epsilon